MRLCRCVDRQIVDLIRVADPTPSTARNGRLVVVFCHRRQPSPPIKRAAKKELPPTSRPSSRDAKKKAVAPAPKGTTATAAAAGSKSGSVAAQKAAAAAAPKRKAPAPKATAAGSAGGLAAPVAGPVPATAGGDGVQGVASQEDEGTGEGEKGTGVKQTKVSPFVPW